MTKTPDSGPHFSNSPKNESAGMAQRANRRKDALYGGIALAVSAAATGSNPESPVAAILVHSLGIVTAVGGGLLLLRAIWSKAFEELKK